jgi:hypothetical protein
MKDQPRPVKQQKTASRAKPVPRTVVTSTQKRVCKHPPSAVIRSRDGERETCVDCGQFRHCILGDRSSWLLPDTEFIP